MPRASHSAINARVIALYGHHGWLRAWLRQHLDCSEAAADIAQDTFLRVLSAQQTTPEQIETPKAYLTCIARRLVINHWRRRDIEQLCLQTLAALPEHEMPSAEAHILMVESLCAIDEALHSLPDQVRQAFLLARVDKLALREVAAQLNCSEASVKRYVQRGLAACLMAMNS